jgi:hypothetical protein
MTCPHCRRPLIEIDHLRRAAALNEIAIVRPLASALLDWRNSLSLGKGPLPTP